MVADIRAMQGRAAIPFLTKHVAWWGAIKRTPAVSAWPFVVVILAQMAVGGFSVYALSTIRAYVTNESLWSKGEHEAVYFLNLYLDTERSGHLDGFKRAVAVPLAYRKARQALESGHPDIAAVSAALSEGGASPQDVPGLIWMFRKFRRFPYLREAIARWRETDPFILELQSLGTLVSASRANADVVTLRNRLEQIDAAITPRAIAFSDALNRGARVVEQLLMLINLAFAGLLAALTVWRVGKILTQRRHIEQELAWQASHDELTGLINRRGFEARLPRVARPERRCGAAAYALMFIDLDQFKIVNDTCGHAAGDALLRRICPAVQALLRPNDLLARLGGDEFAIFLPATNLASALVIAERVRAVVEAIDFVWEERLFGVTASIGLVQNDVATPPEEMMRAADMACYMAKEKGRNRVHVHREKDEEVLGRVKEMNCVQRIHQALNENRFCLHVQEILALQHVENDSLHLEVLIRMQDEAGTLIPPSAFLPAAERFGLVGPIDRWVVRRTFAILAERLTIPDVTPISCCAINLSGATIGDDTFLGFLTQAFEEFQISPGMICFEVTETSAIVNLQAARAFIQHLRALGCTFALDDFGSGMSSFSYLKELPVDFLKIDGGFVKNLLTDRADRAMVEMITHVGHVMGKRIVAEFVETEALAHALRDIGVDYGQGHGIASPKLFNAHFQGFDRPQRSAAVQFERLTA